MSIERRMARKRAADVRKADRALGAISPETRTTWSARFRLWGDPATWSEKRGVSEREREHASTLFRAWQRNEWLLPDVLTRAPANTNKD